MGLFSRKFAIDYEALFKEQYKSINKLMIQVHNEMDYVIKESLLEVVVEKYNELIECIEKGASQDKEHFLSLREGAKKELQMIKDINAE